MKNTLYKITLVLLAFFTLGCDVDDFLTEENINALSTESFWKNESQLEQGLIGAYAALQLPGSMGGSASSQFPVRSDVGRPNTWNANAQGLQRLTFNDNSSIVRSAWDDNYEGINRANQVIENAPNIQMDEQDKILILAQARFLRGLYYYWLYTSYNEGSIVLYTEIAKDASDFNQPLAPKEDVFALIDADLKYARENLPETWPPSDVGRATWGAATAVLADLYINERDFATARDYLKEIIDSRLYSLTPEIGWNFDEAHEFNSESIFEVSYSKAFKDGFGGNANDGANRSESTNRAETLATTTGGGFRVIMPSYWVTMLFKSDSMDMSDPRNEGRTFSIRASESIAMADDEFSTFYGRPSDEGGPYNNQEASYLKKFQNWKLTAEDELGRSGINERVYRLADINLLYAECLLETGGSFDVALDLVNEIRRRSGVRRLVAADYDATSLMEHIRWVERPLELMFEGRDIRWKDLRRWDAVKEQYDRLAELEFVIVEKVLRYYDPAIDTAASPLREYVEAAGNFSPSAHYYFPIPTTERTSNNNLGSGNTEG
ncbi:RagB/SusD family nutrient uptake outer membrane protein [Fulvivirga sp. M361]|uniref:RagB/SusD family nutrient uptake outer membrane protein n=1 Tax=Fulvivirga sp. M361 TaxID=2594266 RepID=UPI001623A9B6|nr:RagB/SusD family nutrient uptake outer membrane protein [Fulvivirga sp. M361]